jgi:hypothetical protein
MNEEIIKQARDLFATYRYILSLPNAPLGESKDLIAKQCALIAVDEIIKVYEFEHPHRGFKVSYWDEVKQAIENL